MSMECEKLGGGKSYSLWGQSCPYTHVYVSFICYNASQHLLILESMCTELWARQNSDFSIWSFFIQMQTLFAIWFYLTIESFIHSLTNEQKSPSFSNTQTFDSNEIFEMIMCYKIRFYCNEDSSPVCISPIGRKTPMLHYLLRGSTRRNLPSTAAKKLWSYFATKKKTSGLA